MSEDTTEETTTETLEDETSLEETVTLTKAEHEAQVNELNRLKRERADTAKKAKEAEKAAKAAAERQKKEDGDWKSLAEQHESDLAAALKDAQEAREALATYERNKVVTEAASALDFRDPHDAHKFLTVEDQADPKLVEAALKRLKKDKPYLIAEPRRTGVDRGADNGSGSSADPMKDHNAFISQVFAGTARRQ